MDYEYQMAGLRIALDLPFSISIQPSSEAFLAAPTGARPDAYFVCRPVSQLPELSKAGHEENNRCFEESAEGSRVFFRSSPTGAPYACVTRRTAEPSVLCCEYLKGQDFRLKYSMSICNMLGLESLLLQFDGLLLHSSFIRWQGKGILFSADSGVGKSTQADLWVKYQGAEILNGDRAGLRKMGACSSDFFGGRKDSGSCVWTAYGLPYAGSSRVYRNESAPIAAVFMLEQATVNEVIPLTQAQALRKLYPQMMIHSWDAAYVLKALPLMEDLIRSVPVYLLRCRPDEGAVETARRMIQREEAWGKVKHKI